MSLFAPTQKEQHRTKLKLELRSELSARGYSLTQDWKFISGNRLPNTPINLDIDYNKDGVLVAEFICKGFRYRHENPTPTGLADNIIKRAVMEATEPPPAIEVLPPKAASGEKNKVKTVQISHQQYLEYIELKRKNDVGIWISRKKAEEIKYGYISSENQQKINAMFDRMLR